MFPRIDLLVTGARLAKVDAAAAITVIDDAAIAVAGTTIAWAGPADAFPPGLNADAARRIELAGALVTAGFVDCHTHLVFSGDRSAEFEKRLAGQSYADIARAGGGIRATVARTRAASIDALVAEALPRAEALLADGVTTLEIKSGYGLDFATERNMLLAAKRIGERLGITVTTTYLGLHARSADAAVDDVAEAIATLDALHGEGLIDAVDAFGEAIAFASDEVARFFDHARNRGIRVKLHADQLSDQGGAALAARYRALSADHIEYADDAGITAMAAAGTVAVLLPGSFYALRETRTPPVAALRRAKVPMAVSTDLNPGTSPLLSMRLALNMACTLFGLTIGEAFAGATINAARALDLGQRKGRLAAGYDADFVIWNAAMPAQLIQWMGGSPARAVYCRGRRVYRASDHID